MQIDVQDVDVCLNDVSILQGVTVSLTHKRIGVIGSNGSGKSTFARLLNGLVLPTRGRVCVDGLDTKQHAKQVRQRVGFVFQNPDQQMVLPTVIEDIAFGLRNQGIKQPQAEQQAVALLRDYGLEGLKDSFVYRISGGEKQMVALLGVLVMQPAWLVLDEPTTLLDFKNTRQIMNTLNALDQHIVMVTHNLDLLHDFDCVLYFKGGRLEGVGKPDDMIAMYLNE
jgi:biotin transport system ATP-binding protein